MYKSDAKNEPREIFNAVYKNASGSNLKKPMIKLPKLSKEDNALMQKRLKAFVRENPRKAQLLWRRAFIITYFRSRNVKKKPNMQKHPTLRHQRMMTQLQKLSSFNTLKRK